MEEELIYKRRSKKPEYFLKGPVPLDWLSRAGRIPGKTLHVGILCWFFLGLKKSNVFKLQKAFLDNFGVHRSSLYKAIQKLEQEGLITTKRKKGQYTSISINTTINRKQELSNGV